MAIQRNQGREHRFPGFLTIFAMIYVALSRRNTSRLDAMRYRLTAVAEYRRKLLHVVSIAAKELLSAETTRFWRSFAQCFLRFTYLIVTTLVSLMGSFFVSAVLSMMAVAGLNYFFAAPLFTFRIADPRDLVVLLAFVLPSLIVTSLVRSA